MYGLLAQIAILAATTRALRALARFAGPRRCGLVLGLPWSTALMLLYCVHDRGEAEAMATAESALLGATAAAALPLAYARAIGGDARRLRAPLSAVAGYAAAATAFHALPIAGAGAPARIALAAVGVLAVCRLARRVRVVGGGSAPGTGRRLPPPALGMLVPSALVVLVRSARALGGPGWAGLFTTFPGMSLSLLASTHLEAGPAAACRLARAMPAGNLITVAFLATFRLAVPRVGPAWGVACGYALALATLLALDALARPAPAAAPVHAIPGPAARRWSSSRGVPAPGAGPARPRRARRPRYTSPGAGRRRGPRKGFAPRLESLSGRRG
jgi:hypothetical protein